MFMWVYSGIAAIILAIAAPTLAFAHVVVSPNTVQTGDWQTFSIGVPNEKDSPTVRLTLQIPQNVAHVTPTMEPGFAIDIKKSGDNVQEITWKGNIPVGQRAEFSFSAQAPAEPSNLDWKADQFYADGSIVHWTQDPNSDKSDTPYSVTKVVDQVTDQSSDASSQSTLAISLSVAAIVLSIGAIIIGRLKRK